MCRLTSKYFFFFFSFTCIFAPRGALVGGDGGAQKIRIIWEGERNSARTMNAKLFLRHSLYAEPLTLRYIRQNLDYQNAVIVSPDAGGAKRATALADRLDLNFALIHKERSRPNEVSRMTLVGDVSGKVAILVDDMADTCGTLCKAADVLIENGAKEVVAIVTHGILSGDACEKVEKSRLSRLVVTDTVPHEDKKRRCAKIDTIDVAPTVSDSLCFG